MTLFYKSPIRSVLLEELRKIDSSHGKISESAAKNISELAEYSSFANKLRYDKVRKGLDFKKYFHEDSKGHFIDLISRIEPKALPSFYASVVSHAIYYSKVNDNIKVALEHYFIEMMADYDYHHYSSVGLLQAKNKKLNESFDEFISLKIDETIKEVQESVRKLMSLAKLELKDLDVYVSGLLPYFIQNKSEYWTLFNSNDKALEDYCRLCGKKTTISRKVIIRKDYDFEAKNKQKPIMELKCNQNQENTTRDFVKILFEKRDKSKKSLLLACSTLNMYKIATELDRSIALQDENSMNHILLIGNKKVFDLLKMMGNGESQTEVQEKQEKEIREMNPFLFEIFCHVQKFTASMT